ncbi:MAG: hypothetical protein BWX93_01724 [Bacteroidetes bacterium ADurb.Bin139]|jgi:hypothetical protein|nr:MAG: hypothetical protein BWX93_01724 [Bacteroidetes bacterium ADurb.Bin139]
MWSNRPSFLLLVQVRQTQKAGFIIPLALPVLDATLRSWRDSLEFWESIFPGFNAQLLVKDKLKISSHFRLSQVFAWGLRLLAELRRYGPYEFVHVDNGEQQVSIRLW